MVFISFLPLIHRLKYSSRKRMVSVTGKQGTTHNAPEWQDSCVLRTQQDRQLGIGGDAALWPLTVPTTWCCKNAPAGLRI